MLNIAIVEEQESAGRQYPFSFRVHPDTVELGEDASAFIGEILIEGSVAHTGEDYRAEGVIVCRRTYLCDRCLAPCEEEMSISFREDFRRDALPEEPESPFSGDRIDLRELVRDTLLASQPLSNVCRPDCKGLCPVCGTDLNAGECSCERFAPDPRMAALQDLIRGNNDR